MVPPRRSPVSAPERDVGAVGESGLPQHPAGRSASVAGCQRGERSLSITCARMPSARSGCVVANHITSPYSCSSASRSPGSSRARRTAASVTASPVGESSPSRSAVADASGSGRARSRSTISATVSAAKASSIHARAASSFDGAGVSSNSSTSSVGLDGSARVSSASRTASRLRVGHEVVGESGVDRVRGIHHRAGESEVLAEAPRRVGEQPGAADVGGEADARLGHRELRALGHDADRRVPGDADPAAHRDAVGERDERLRVLGDAGVERVLVAEEHRGVLGAAARDLLGEPAHVAARAEPALAGAVEQHDVDVGVVLPRVEASRAAAGSCRGRAR